MATNLEDQLIDKVRGLPPDKQREATDPKRSLPKPLIKLPSREFLTQLHYAFGELNCRGPVWNYITTAETDSSL